MSATYEDFRDCTLYPALPAESHECDYGWAAENLRVGVYDDGDVALVFGGQCIIVPPDAARRLLAQLQDALGEKAEPYVTDDGTGRLVIRDGVRTVPLVPPLKPTGAEQWYPTDPPQKVPCVPNPYSPWAPGKVIVGTSSKSFELPTDTIITQDAGHYECEGRHYVSEPE